MKQVILFPGQGSQFVGMGKDLYQEFSCAREVFEELDDTLSQKLSDIIFEGPSEKLMQTENTQPALMAVSMATLSVLKAEGLDTKSFSSAAGHSLGEYSALCAAGVLTFSNAVSLLKERGLAMQKAVPLGKGGMVALIGASVEDAEKISKKASSYGVCEVANDNCPGQVVLSGELKALSHVSEISKDFSVRKAIALNVSAPFHSSLMDPAAQRMNVLLKEVPFKDSSFPILPNVTVTPEMKGDIFRNLLVRQITGRVRWTETLLKLESLGIERFVEVGAGKVLSGLVKRTCSNAEAISVQTPQEIESFLNTLVKN